MRHEQQLVTLKPMPEISNIFEHHYILTTIIFVQQMIIEIHGMCVVKLTVKLTLAMEGPFVNNISTISLFPAHAARCNGLDPLSSALLHEAS